MFMIPKNPDSTKGDRLGGLINQFGAESADSFNQYRMERQNTVQAFLTGRHQDQAASPYDDLPLVKPKRFEEIESAWRQRSLCRDGLSAPNYYEISAEAKGSGLKLDRLNLRAKLKDSGSHLKYSANDLI